MNNQTEILTFRPELAHHFDTINRQWVESMFTVEPLDDAMLKDPEAFIINKGGFIWFARHPDLGIVGTCALCRHDEGVFELTKMGVLENARGLKVGEKLLLYVIEQSKAMKHETTFLLTNKKCEAAIHLYEKCGFLHDKEIMAQYGQNYQRCNVAMRLSND